MLSNRPRGLSRVCVAGIRIRGRGAEGRRIRRMGIILTHPAHYGITARGEIQIKNILYGRWMRIIKYTSSRFGRQFILWTAAATGASHFAQRYNHNNNNNIFLTRPRSRAQLTTRRFTSKTHSPGCSLYESK